MALKIKKKVEWIMSDKTKSPVLKREKLAKTKNDVDRQSSQFSGKCCD